MNERCSAVLLNKLSLKEKDPKSFTIPYDIYQLHINNALADLEASISLMPYTMYEKLGLDMPEDSRVPIILGRPFLTTAQAVIDVFNKKITLRVGQYEEIFDVYQSIKREPTEDDKCYGIDDLDDTINAEAQELLANDEPDSFLLRGLEKSIDQSDLEDFVQQTVEPVKLEREHLYSARANEIDEKKPEIKDLPNHLEYGYLHGDKSFSIIISSELSDKEKVSLLQVLEKRKEAIAWKMSKIKGINSEHSTITYTSISSDYEEPSDVGPPRVVVYGYNGLPMHPPSPDYVPGPEHPPSLDYVPSPEHPPSPVYVPYVLEPAYPKFMPHDDDVFPAEKKPLPAVVSPTTGSPGYMTLSDAKEDPEEDDEDPEEDPTDYLAEKD
ncbi:hypothetical protein Tco_0948347, partial [Tanacetum coccineum]